MTSVTRTSPCVGFGAPLDVPPLLDVDVPPLLLVPPLDVPPLDDVDVPPLLLPPLDVPPLDDPPLLDDVLSSPPEEEEVDGGSFDDPPPSARAGSPLPSTPGRFGSTSGVMSGVSVDAQAATRIVANAASRRDRCSIWRAWFCYALRRDARKPDRGDARETSSMWGNRAVFSAE
jgi:hypothetical protein